MKPLALALFLVVSITICRGVEGELTFSHKVGRDKDEQVLWFCSRADSFPLCLHRCGREKSVPRKVCAQRMQGSKMHSGMFEQAQRSHSWEMLA
ncbi:hypothetical protein FRX31_008238 [Thalictrum thalictroides]|uniref:Uncharacterized protein n=1 Tax=Thalictrum thalictroides TaxID=46969 RepID=A0A7J6X015_THATH|nr:hypothetical protein FRX31_008238 [Thalictrum thalictroides]